jgi:hypothetical protein
MLSVEGDASNFPNMRGKQETRLGWRLYPRKEERMASQSLVIMTSALARLRLSCICTVENSAGDTRDRARLGGHRG